MRKFYAGIVNRRKLILIMFAVAFVISLLCGQLVSVNYDMTDLSARKNKINGINRHNG